MTIEEAIKIINISRIQADCAKGVTMPAEAEKERDDYIDACTMAIEALEKKIPKKPYGAEIRPYGFSWRCPTCEAEVFHDVCMVCGQRLDWSEEEC